MVEIESKVQPLEILLVEDNLGDARLIMETMKDGNIQNRMHLAKDGLKGLEYLRSCLQEGGSPLPNLVLLDLNLPRMDGWEVLQAIKSDPALKHLPVVILTSSEASEDVRRTYDLSANCYLTKPVGLKTFENMVLSLEHFWSNPVQLPKR